MKIKKLEITGFKSFVDKTAIHFPIGISAIVGPNGCGKSNIMDAFRWVMGEQSVKQLRGKSMEDIIFSGTNGRPPLNIAEVSLTLLNDNGSAPEELKDFTEIMLTRRLYRSGESAYYINKQPSRLKDIHNLFMGSGMGAKSYSVIQQGNVGAITEAGPEERRYFIEEAAGITRYKSRKVEALRKVEATQQNLLRVLDIIGEINRQMSGLQRQAKKAEIYKKFQEKIRFLDITLGMGRCDELAVQIQDAGNMLTRLKDKDQAHTAELSRIDAAIEAIKLKRQQKFQEISDQKSNIFNIQRNIDKLENDLLHLRKDILDLGAEITGFESIHLEITQKNSGILSEMGQAKTEIEIIVLEIERIKTLIDREQSASRQVKEKLEQLNRSLESDKSGLMTLVAEEARYKNIFQNAVQNKESLKRRLKKIDEEEFATAGNVSRLEKEENRSRENLESVKSENESLEKEIAIVRKQLEEKSALLGQHVKFIQTLEIQRNQADSKFTALKKMQDSYQWYKDGVKAVMKHIAASKEKDSNASRENTASSRVLGLMADILEPEHLFETAVEAVLGESLQYILVKDHQAGWELIDFLREGKAGRSGFIPLSAIRAIHCDHWTRPDPALRLLNHVRVKPGFESIAEAFLGHVVVVEDAAQAMVLFQKNGIHQTIVAKDGNIITAQGVMVGGSKDNLSGILEKKHEIKELEIRISALDEQLITARQTFKGLENEIRDFENTLQKRLEHRHRLSREEIEAEKALYKITEDLKHARKHLEIIRLEQEQMMGEESDMDEQMEKYNRALTEIEGRVKASQDQVARSSQAIAGLAVEMDSFNQKVMDLKLELTAQNAGLENSHNTLRRLKAYYEDGEKRLEQIAADIELKLSRKSASENKIAQAEPALRQMVDSLKQFEQGLEINETDYHAIDEEIRSTDGIVNEIKSKREETLQKIRLLEVEKSQLEMKRDNTLNRLTERWQSAPMELKSRIQSDDDMIKSYGQMAVPEMEEELSRCRQQIEKITDVNLGAVREYEELKTRFEFLEEQRNDLQKAIENLHKVIRKINRITQEKFLKTFHEINEKLGVVFPRLFEGGSAALVMTDPDNPLESGVEFMIHPPGKKLTRLSLLSGGEKALSAIAFIFSIFLIKPTSFCLMDEIDAPLDDANVFRFNDLLKIIGEKSQIIMITHNKRSMEFADSLFGVTMEKKGVSKVVAVNFEKQTDYSGVAEAVSA
jgi:chromosome segregation protein